MEVFGGGSSHKYVSKRELDEIKRNMRKVPEIQKKSDDYHKKQAEEAEKELKSITETLQIPNEEIIENDDSEKKLNLRQKIKKWLKKMFISSN